MKLIVAVSLSLLALLSCGVNDKSETKVFHIESENKLASITIFERENIRIICNGLLKDIPSENYVVIDMQGVDDVYDALYYCWINDGWNALIPKTKIIESNLDSLKFNFKTELPIDNRGIPTASKFSEVNCNVFDFSLEKLMRDTDTVTVY